MADSGVRCAGTVTMSPFRPPKRSKSLLQHRREVKLQKGKEAHKKLKRRIHCERANKLSGPETPNDSAVGRHRDQSRTQRKALSSCKFDLLADSTQLPGELSGLPTQNARGKKQTSKKRKRQSKPFERTKLVSSDTSSHREAVVGEKGVDETRAQREREVSLQQVHEGIKFDRRKGRKRGATHLTTESTPPFTSERDDGKFPEKELNNQQDLQRFLLGNRSHLWDQQQQTELFVIGHMLADEIHAYLNPKHENRRKRPLSAGERCQLVTWQKDARKQLVNKNSVVLENVVLVGESRKLSKLVRLARDDLMVLRTHARNLSEEGDVILQQLSQSQQAVSAKLGAGRLLVALEKLTKASKPKKP